MTKADYFEAERQRELPFLDATVERYDMLFIDTSSIMSPAFPKFAANIIPLLKKYNKSITVCESVLRELKRLKSISGFTDYLVREVYAFMGLYTLDRFIEHGVLQYVNDGIENGPADLAFQKLFISLRPQKRLLLIAQDANLTSTILRFNLDRSVYAEPIGVKSLTMTGFLDPKSKPALLPKSAGESRQAPSKPHQPRQQVVADTVAVKEVETKTEEVAPEVQKPEVSRPRPAIHPKPVAKIKPAPVRPMLTESSKPQTDTTSGIIVKRYTKDDAAEPVKPKETKVEVETEDVHTGTFTAKDAKRITGAALHVPEGYTAVGYIERPDITAAYLPDSVKAICDQAFKDCMSLIHVVMPDSVEVISSSAFFNCRSLVSIKIPPKVTAIENGTFKNCVSLRDCILHNNVKTIGSIAFKGCRSLRKILIPESVTEIGKNAFSVCPELIIYCYEGSYAAAYAIAHEISYRLIDTK